MRRLTALAAVGLMALAGAARAAEPPPAPGLKGVVIANKAAYRLDPAQRGQAFRDKLAAIKKARRPLPVQPPAVDLTLRITNTSDGDITVKLGGDESRVLLTLAGPGAVTVPNMVAMTMEYRMGKPVTIGPGRSHDIAIQSLLFGIRGISDGAFWTEPGEYTVGATLVTLLGEQQVSVAGTPAKAKVAAGE